MKKEFKTGWIWTLIQNRSVSILNVELVKRVCFGYNIICCGISYRNKHLVTYKL